MNKIMTLSEFLSIIITSCVSLLVFAGVIVMTGFNYIWSRLQYCKSLTEKKREKLRCGWEVALIKLKSITKFSCYIIISSLLIIAFLSKQSDYELIIMIIAIGAIYIILDKIKGFVEKVLATPKELSEEKKKKRRRKKLK